MLVDAVSSTTDHPLHAAVWNGAARFAVFYLCALLVATVVVMARDDRATSRTDPLTGLLNRKGFADLAELEVARAIRSGAPATVLYLDVDGFKAVNDVQGHAAGDRLLVDVARTLFSQARRVDVVARQGGDEFVCLLSDTGSEAASVAAHRTKAALDEMCMRHRWPVRFSIGLATFVRPPASVDDLLSAGDRLMYDAKRDGKVSKVSSVVAEELTEVRAP